MSKQMNQRQLKKKKDRERRGKERAAIQREINRKKKKSERLIDLAVKRTRPRGETFVSENKQALKKIEQLSHNQKVLAALEEEYKKEVEAREKFNIELASAGCESIEDKLNYVKENAERHLNQLKSRIVTAEQYAEEQLKKETQEN